MAVNVKFKLLYIDYFLIRSLNCRKNNLYKISMDHAIPLIVNIFLPFLKPCYPQVAGLDRVIEIFAYIQRELFFQNNQHFSL